VFARIIVGVDGAEGGRDACALAGALVDPDADVILARVAPVPSPVAGATRAGGPGSFAAARTTFQAALGVETSPDVSAVAIDARSVADGLHQLAEEHSANLIVVGSHHRRRAGALWSANRTRATLRDAPCPVAIAPRGFADDPGLLTGVVGIAYDDTPEARDALLFGRALASETGARIQILWVVERSNWTDSESREGWKAREAGRRLADLHGVTGAAVEGDAREGREALTRFAHHVDLLILGSHHHGLLRRLVLGDTVESLSQHTPCPLLVMPHVGLSAKR